MTDRLVNMIKVHAANLDQTIGSTKFAVVSSVNYSTGAAKVVIQPEGVLSGWLPVLSPWTGNGWGMQCPVAPGDQVVVICQEGDIEQGIIVGRSYSLRQVPPPTPAGEFWLVHATGAALKLCNDGTIRISGDLHVQGDIFDAHGSVAQLRNHYNSHSHRFGANQASGPPDRPD